jgi:hypothetical protein
MYFYQISLLEKSEIPLEYIESVKEILKSFEKSCISVLSSPLSTTNFYDYLEMMVEKK